MKWRRRFQFRLSSLLWLMVAVAAAISGYRAGLDEQLARQQPGDMYIKSYPVRDLTFGPGMRQADSQTLMDLLVLLSPQKWHQSGGKGSMTVYDEAGILVVCQDAATHRQIERKLAALRRLNSPWRSWLNGLVAWVNQDEPI